MCCYLLLLQLAYYDLRHLYTHLTGRSNVATEKLLLVSKQHAEVSPPDNSGPESDPVNIKVKGSYGSKMTSILSLLLSLKTPQTGNSNDVPKVLIFSLWEDMLQILESGLIENDIRFLRLSGTQKRSFNTVLTEFK